MYRSLVRRQYRAAWDAMNRHDYEVILRLLAPEFEVTFVGDTSLGGSRRSEPAMRRWFQRLFVLFPDARFRMMDVAVDGWPRNTRIFGAFEIHATVLGRPYRNVFVQHVRMRWGRITGYSIYEDSLRFWRAAQEMAHAGIAEAAAPAVTDDTAGASDTAGGSGEGRSRR